MKLPILAISPVVTATICLALASVAVTGCQNGDSAGPDATATPWPTLASVQTIEPILTSTVIEQTGPELVEQFRTAVASDTVSIFPLRGEIAHPARIEVIVLSGQVDPVLVINTITGDELAVSNSGSLNEPEVIGQFQFPGDGYYELGIVSASGVGEVGVSVYRLDPAQLEGGGTFTSSEEELRGTMVHPSTYHTFRIPIERGKRVDVYAYALTEGLDLLFEFYGPDGVLLAARDDNEGPNPVLWSFLPRQSGTYTLVLSNFDENIGDYVVGISPSEEGVQAIVGTRTEIALAAIPRIGTWLTVEGRALNGIRIESRPLSPGIDLALAIYDPYGNLLAQSNQFGQDEPEQITLVQFPFDGTYQIELSTFSGEGLADYFIRETGQADIEYGGRISPGRTRHEGEMVGPATAITYVFDGQAGDLIGIDAHATGDTGLDLGFDLFSPDGYLLVQRDDVIGKNPVLDRFELPVTGRYSLVLWNYAGTTGPYDLFLTDPEAPADLPSSP